MAGFIRLLGGAGATITPPPHAKTNVHVNVYQKSTVADATSGNSVSASLR
jgi:hypothetical protein